MAAGFMIDRLCYCSKLRRVNAYVKFMYTVSTLICCIISRSFLIAGIVLVVNGILTVGIGKIPFARYRNMMLMPLMFLLLSTAAILINFAKEPMDGYAIPVGDMFITGSRAALISGGALIATAMASVSCLYFFTLNTTMTDVLGVMEKLHIPALMIELMMLIYRFIFILLEEASSITTAQRSRLGDKDLRTSLRSFGQMAAALLVRAIRRSRVLYDAMESRCYDGRLKVLRKNQPIEKKHLIMLVSYEVLIYGILIMEKII